jgi:hypothetical protein
MLSERGLRAILYFLAAYHLATGLLALIAPGTFFEEIGNYAPENENLHYVGDVGAFQFAAGFGLLMAAKRPSWRVPMLMVGAVWYGAHAINHAFDTDEARSEARGIFDTLALAFAALGSLYLSRVADRLERAAGDASRPVPTE